MADSQTDDKVAGKPKPDKLSRGSKGTVSKKRTRSEGQVHSGIIVKADIRNNDEEVPKGEVSKAENKPIVDISRRRRTHSDLEVIECIKLKEGCSTQTNRKVTLDTQSTRLLARQSIHTQPMLIETLGGPTQPNEQPILRKWMALPTRLTGCPPGLEYLTELDELKVKQRVELWEGFTGWEIHNKYVISNNFKEQVYYAEEESHVIGRQCCGAARGFVMHITDKCGTEVIRVVRPFKCCTACQCLALCDCCALEVSIEAPVGSIVAYVKQVFSCLAPNYHILDAERRMVLGMSGPVCICSGPLCTWEQSFAVISPDIGSEVGTIRRQYSGYERQRKAMFSNAENFGVKFPPHLDNRIKAALLGAVFLIEFMFFESNDHKNW